MSLYRILIGTHFNTLFSIIQFGYLQSILMLFVCIGYSSVNKPVKRRDRKTNVLSRYSHTDTSGTIIAQSSTTSTLNIPTLVHWPILLKSYLIMIIILWNAHKEIFLVSGESNQKVNPIFSVPNLLFFAMQMIFCTQRNLFGIWLI